MYVARELIEEGNYPQPYNSRLINCVLRGQYTHS